jgi:hypothetical protein
MAVVVKSSRAAKGIPGAAPLGALNEVAIVHPGASACAVPDTTSDATVATLAQTFVKANMRTPPSVKKKASADGLLHPIGRKVCQIN